MDNEKNDRWWKLWNSAHFFLDEEALIKTANNLNKVFLIWETGEKAIMEYDCKTESWTIMDFGFNVKIDGEKDD